MANKSSLEIDRGILAVAVTLFIFIVTPVGNFIMDTKRSQTIQEQIDPIKMQRLIYSVETLTQKINELTAEVKVIKDTRQTGETAKRQHDFLTSNHDRDVRDLHSEDVRLKAMIEDNDREIQELHTEFKVCRNRFKPKSSAE